VCDTVSELAVVLMDNGAWPELVPALFEMVQTGNERLMSSALAVFAELALYVVDCLVPVFDTIQQMLGATMGHPSLEVQLQSLRLISGFIQVRGGGGGARGSGRAGRRRCTRPTAGCSRRHGGRQAGTPLAGAAAGAGSGACCQQRPAAASASPA
jgi:hypothetical protein